MPQILNKLCLLIVLFAISFSANAQAPNLLNYQGVARNSAGNPLPNQKMNLRLSVHDRSATGNVVYSETRVIITNLGGLFSVQVGSTGTTSTSGTIEGVSWLSGDKYLQVEIAPENNNNYLNLGTVQLVSVPYAFNAVTASNALTVTTNANLTGVVTSVGNATSIASGAITSDMIGTLNKSKVGLDLVNNTSDAAKPISTLTQAALGTKLNVADSTSAYITPTQLAANKFDLTPITNAIAGKLAIADSTNSYVTPAKLAAKAFDSTSISNRINLKANTSSLATVATSGSYNDLTNKPTVPDAYSLATASASTLGGIKVGSNLSIDDNGVLSASSSNSASSLTGIVPIEKGGTSTTSIDGIKSLLGLNSLNVAIGVQSGTTNQASDAIAIGGGSGKNNQANATIAIGYVAGYDNQGSGSIAIGGNAGQGSQGHHSVAIGAAAGQNGQGAYSVAIGTFAGNVQAANSIALNATGTSLNTQTTGFFVDPVRAAATTPDLLFYNSTTKEITSTAGGIITTGAQTFTGDKTFSDLINGISVGAYLGGSNTMLGYNAFSNSTPGVNNTALGYKALSNAIGGNDNTAIGANVLSGRGSALANGWRNTAVGVDALKNGGGGSDNVAIGFLTLPNTTGGANTAVGMYALLSNTIATANVAVGAYAQYGTTVGENNTSIGTASMALNTSGAQNTVMGANAIEKNILGSNNTVLGFSAGKYFSNLVSTSTENSNVNNSVLIGASSKTLALNSDNEVVIGYNAVGNGSNTIQLGNTSIVKVKTSGDIETGSAKAFYFGDPTVDGTWRINRSVNNLIFEIRVSGAWVTKTTMTP